MVTSLHQCDLGHLSDLPTVRGLDDADLAAWVRANDYTDLTTHLAEIDGHVFPAHIKMLTTILG
ncbi:hypothetical protein [Fodinicola feengrottensis]|uniref:Uncharacterized protein n=1 Tax=Fodinicola feengrottensis TaxID=435914 RepID=A0ABP4RLR4_9ACTN|nr:hypothetical protein [Fodinicola feengrottensis]